MRIQKSEAKSQEPEVISCPESEVGREIQLRNSALKERHNVAHGPAARDGLRRVPSPPSPLPPALRPRAPYPLDFEHRSSGRRAGGRGVPEAGEDLWAKGSRPRLRYSAPNGAMVGSGPRSRT